MGKVEQRLKRLRTVCKEKGFYRIGKALDLKETGTRKLRDKGIHNRIGMEQQREPLGRISI